jgi:hypothetical protein
MTTMIPLIFSGHEHRILKKSYTIDLRLDLKGEHP